MRCGKKCLFKILVTASSGKPTPELYFLPGQLRWTLFPKSATAIHSVAVDRTKATWRTRPFKLPLRSEKVVIIFGKPSLHWCGKTCNPILLQAFLVPFV